MTQAFIDALMRRGLTLISNDYGRCTLVFTSKHAHIRVATTATAALIERLGADADSDYTVTLSHVPDDVALAIVESVLP